MNRRFFLLFFLLNSCGTDAYRAEQDIKKVFDFKSCEHKAFELKDPSALSICITDKEVFYQHPDKTINNLSELLNWYINENESDSHLINIVPASKSLLGDQSNFIWVHNQIREAYLNKWKAISEEVFGVTDISELPRANRGRLMAIFRAENFYIVHHLSDGEVEQLRVLIYQKALPINPAYVEKEEKLDWLSGPSGTN